MNLRQMKKHLKQDNETKLLNLLKEIDNKLPIIPDSINFEKYSNLKYYKSTVYFKFQDLPFWKFCVSLNFYGDNIIRYFGEHVYLIDKFRPSSTYVSTENLNDFLKLVNSIIKDEKYHTVNSLKNGNLDCAFLEKEIDGEKYYTGYQVSYIKNETGDFEVVQDTSIVLENLIEEKYSKLFTDELDNNLKRIEIREYGLKILKEFLFTKDFVKGFGFVDINVLKRKSYFSSNYRLDILLDDSAYNNNVLINSFFYEIEEFINKNNYKGNPFDANLCIEVGYLYNNKNFMKSCHYKFFK